LHNIIVAGYPKSGTSWLCRLVGELLQAPVVGYLNSAKDEIAAEGLARRSLSRVQKAHHTWDELSCRFKCVVNQLVYVVRDPRDVIVSGAHFFAFGAATFSEQLNSMTRAVLEGDASVNPCCAIPWRDHYKAFAGSGCLLVRYEDILDTPEIVCRTLLRYFSVDVDNVAIQQAISLQSFEFKKNAFTFCGDHRRAAHLRAGVKGQWRDCLSVCQQKEITTALASELTELRYPLV
jgi:hypothetical protein